MLNRLFYICLGLILFLCLLINVVTVYDGHNWGGDFSQYIIHAQNLVQGKAYGDGIMLNNPVVYPPGYPLIISPVIKFFGLNFRILKLLNVVFWYGALFPVFFILSKHLGKDLAILFVLVLATSSNFFVFKQNVLSDIPFYFFVSFTLSFFICRCEHKRLNSPNEIVSFVVLLLLISFSFFIRSAGVVLFLAAILHFLIKKDFKRMGLTIAALVLAFITLALWIGVHKGFFSEILANPQVFVIRSLKNCSLVFKSLFWFFCPGQTVLIEKINLAGNYLIEFASPILYCLVLAYFVYQVGKRRISFLGIFWVMYLGILFVWSGFESDIRGFVRFVYPLTAGAAIFLFEGVSLILRKVFGTRYQERYWKICFKGILVLVVFLNIFNIFGIYWFNDDVLFVEANQELFNWIRENIRMEDRYMIWRPRPVALLTGRVGTVPWREDLREDVSIYQRIQALNISYLILSKHVDQDLIFSFKQNFRFSRMVWENESYMIFHVFKP